MYQHGEHGEAGAEGGHGHLLARALQIQPRLRAFSRLLHGPARLGLDHRGLVLIGFFGLSLLSLGLGRFVGRDFFPEIDAGQLRLQCRAPAGTRIEQTEVLFGDIEAEIRRVIPPANSIRFSTTSACR